MNQPIPNRFPVPEDQEPEHQKKPSWFSEINAGGIILIVVVIVLCVIAWIMIRDLSMLGGSFGSVVTQWIDRASIDPQNQRGFVSFLKLLLTAGFIAILLIIFRKR